MIDRMKKSVLQEKEVASIFFQACRAVYYMHSKRIIHRDLKAANILINQKVILKLADLGQSKTLAENRGFASSICGTPGY
jgi:serine/threonine protein kinase